jgi:hypothetical protein
MTDSDITNPSNSLLNNPTENLSENPLDAGIDLHALDDLTLDGRPTVLDRLGPAHFRSKGFSFMGFLQTVYDHVAEHATAYTPGTDTTGAYPPDATPTASVDTVDDKVDIHP